MGILHEVVFSLTCRRELRIGSSVLSLQTSVVSVELFPCRLYPLTPQFKAEWHSTDRCLRISQVQSRTIKSSDSRGLVTLGDEEHVCELFSGVEETVRGWIHVERRTGGWSRHATFHYSNCVCVWWQPSHSVLAYRLSSLLMLSLHSPLKCDLYLGCKRVCDQNLIRSTCPGSKTHCDRILV